MMTTAEIVLLGTASAVDAFIACFAYGASRIHVSRGAAAVIDITGAVMLTSALGLAGLLRPYLSAQVARLAGSALLFAVGAVKFASSRIKAHIRRHLPLDRELRFSLFHLQCILHVYADPPSADCDASRTLSAREALPVAVALSLDGLAAGFGAGLGTLSPWLVLAASLLLGGLAIGLGCRLGGLAARRIRGDCSWVGGTLLMALALLKWLV